MKTSLRFLAGVAALAGLGLSVSACDVSPYAASVNGQVIKQVTLNSRLQLFTANKAYVAATAKAASQGQSGVSAILGDGGSGTYTSSFVAGTLGQMVIGAIVHQQLVRSGDLPSAAMVAAARGVYESDASESYWYGFPMKLRQELATSLAEQAVLVTPSASTKSTLDQGYSELSQYMFTQVCVHQSYAPTEEQAGALTASQIASGPLDCFDQASLELQASAFRDALFAAKVGSTSLPVAASGGYVVFHVVSRQTVPNDTDTQKVLTVILDSNNDTPVPALDSLITHAHVQINPTYGTWDASTGSVKTPQLQAS